MYTLEVLSHRAYLYETKKLYNLSQTEKNHSLQKDGCFDSMNCDYHYPFSDMEYDDNFIIAIEDGETTATYQSNLRYSEELDELVPRDLKLNILGYIEPFSKRWNKHIIRNIIKLSNYV